MTNLSKGSMSLLDVRHRQSHDSSEVLISESLGFKNC